MGAPRTFPAIYKILTDNPGKVIRVETLAKATRLTEQQVRSAIAERRRRDEVHRNTIHVMFPGKAWMFNDVTSTSTSQNGYQPPNHVPVTDPVEEVTVIPVSKPVESPVPAADQVGEDTQVTVHGICAGDLLECVGFSGGNTAPVIRSANGQLFIAKPL